jgi:hypothetical protein
MALTAMPDFTFKHVNQADQVSGDPAAYKTNMDSQAKAIRDFMIGTQKTEIDAHLIKNAIDAHASIPQARVSHSASQSIAHNTVTTLVFDTEEIDTDAMHSNVTNNSRLTINTAGKYIIESYMTFASNATGSRAVVVKKNGTITLVSISQNSVSDTTTRICTVAPLITLSIGDYIETHAFQVSGGSLDVSGQVFTITKVG